jgi:hypothetical protein
MLGGTGWQLCAASPNGDESTSCCWQLLFLLLRL